MFEITPRIFASTFSSFLVRRAKGGHGLPLNVAVKAFFIGVVLSFITLTLGKHELASKGIFERLIGSVLATSLFFSIITLLTMFGAYFFLWPKKWIYGDSNLKIESLFSQSILDYHNIKEVVLESPYCANIIFKDPNSMFLKVGNWYGSSRQDWLRFIEFLNSRISVDDKIGVIYREGFKFVEKKMNSPEEAYDFVEKKCPKLTFDHLKSK